MRAVAAIVLAALALAGSAFADPLPAQAVRVVDYQISVTLDPQTHQLKGTERVTWRNPSAEPVPDLWFHLYLNAFKNTKSTFYRESDGQLRGERAAEDSWGWVDVTSMKTSTGTDLLPSLTFEHPDDDNVDDRTVAKVVLPEPVPAGGSITLDIAFASTLPQVFARTGYKHDFYLVGQWFPKLGVYETPGMRGRTTGAWNCHQFHASSEFYADFGTFTVDITVPASFVVGATGVRTNTRKNPNGTVTYTHQQADVHDFAWTADPDFVPVTGTFSGTKDVTAAEYRQVADLLGRSLDEVRLSDVQITALVQPGHMAQAQRHIESAKAAIKWYGLWYGAYPYQTLTVVDPAPGASGAAGMEYPTLITAGTSFVFNRWPFDRIRALEMVTIHEFGHNFWYGLVGSNEFEEAWLDEGITSYSTGLIVDKVYGTDRGMVESLGLRMGETDILRASNGPDMRYNRILARSWDYVPTAQYGFYVYQKPEMMLRTLQGLLGDQTMARVMRTFHERWRFRHPDSNDFVAVANEVSGRDLSAFFEQVLRGTGTVDFDVASAVSRPVREDRGVFDTPGGRKTVTASEARDKEAEALRTKKALYETVVLVRRRGEVTLPVDVDLKFEGTPVERYVWDGEHTTRKFRFVRPERLEWAEVDRDHKLVLDVNWLNNGRRLEPDTRVAATWSSRWLFFAQNVLFWLGL